MAKRGNMMLSGINALPDELFVSIKEAVATSILARQWKNLWTFTNKLDFDGLDFYKRMWSRKCIEYSDKEFFTFLKGIWCDSIDEFRVDFFLAEAHEKHIDRWLRVASYKNVKRLELNLRWIPLSESKGYTFPRINFKHLRTLRMQWVNVAGEDLEFLLGTRPMLEELSVSYSDSLTTLKIINLCPPLPLKRLEINHCLRLTSVEIHDINLVFFMYHGVWLQQFALKNVPHLVEMHLGGKILHGLQDFLSMFSTYLPQLEKLTIDEVARMLYDNVRMSNLKQLIFKVHEHCNLLSVTYFIGASPVLQSFILEACCDRDESWVFYERVESYLFPHLKRVELIGYRGAFMERILVEHLLRNGVALEEFIIDVRKLDNAPFYVTYFWPTIVNDVLPLGEEQINAAKARARKQFAKILKIAAFYRLAKALPSTFQHLHLKFL